MKNVPSNSNKKGAEERGSESGLQACQFDEIDKACHLYLIIRS